MHDAEICRSQSQSRLGVDHLHSNKGVAMAIASSVEKGGLVYVYNEKGSVICTLPNGNRSDDGLKGYTGSTVSVQRDGLVYVYNERGSVVKTIPAR